MCLPTVNVVQNSRTTNSVVHELRCHGRICPRRPSINFFQIIFLLRASKSQILYFYFLFLKQQYPTNTSERKNKIWHIREKTLTKK